MFGCGGGGVREQGGRTCRMECKVAILFPCSIDCCRGTQSWGSAIHAVWHLYWQLRRARRLLGNSMALMRVIAFGRSDSYTVQQHPMHSALGHFLSSAPLDARH